MAKKEVQGKYPIELNIVGDGRIFLNFWDYAHGNDVVAEIINGKLLQRQGNGPKKEIPFKNFIFQVMDSIEKRTI